MKYQIGVIHLTQQNKTNMKQILKNIGIVLTIITLGSAFCLIGWLAVDNIPVKILAPIYWTLLFAILYFCVHNITKRK